VALVVDGVSDNRPGEVNTRDNWGNAVVLYHAPGLYTAYAHLQPRSTRLKVGDVVGAGAEIGRCGSSGRSPVPHLHFQAQVAAPLGSPSLPADLGDVVTTEGDHEVLSTRSVPTEGAAVRPVLRDEALALALALPTGGALLLRDRDTAVEERAEVEIDLAGRTVIRSPRARLYAERYEGGLVMSDFEGDPRSMLRYLLVALSRVPFDQASSLAFREDLPLRLLRGGWSRPLLDLLAMVAPRMGSARVDYTCRREGGSLVLRGCSAGWTSEARIDLAGGPHRIQVQRGDRTVSIDVAQAPHASEEAA
jgi:hypothetical protein